MCLFIIFRGFKNGKTPICIAQQFGLRSVSHGSIFLFLRYLGSLSDTSLLTMVMIAPVLSTYALIRFESGN